MLSDDKKERIDALSTEEMGREVALAHRSRFQREAFTYLKERYESRRGLEEREYTDNVLHGKGASAPSGTNSEWHKRPLGDIVLKVAGVVLGAAVLYLLARHGLNLR